MCDIAAEEVDNYGDCNYDNLPLKMICYVFTKNKMYLLLSFQNGLKDGKRVLFKVKVCVLDLDNQINILYDDKKPFSEQNKRNSEAEVQIQRLKSEEFGLWPPPLTPNQSFVKLFSQLNLDN